MFEGNYRETTSQEMGICGETRRVMPDSMPEALVRCYHELRVDICDLEKLIEEANLPEKELKRLNKAVVFLKIGAKSLKKIARRTHGSMKVA